jgi:hypothetical protein
MQIPPLFAWLQTAPSVAQTSMVTEAASWVVLGFLALMALLVIYYIYTGKINLSRLISEPTGDASMSRFQLLIFTFVIAASLFLIVASGKPTPAFPSVIPQGVLILLGISSSSYLVSKGIQFSTDEGVKERQPEVVISPSTAVAKAGGAPVQFTFKILRAEDRGVQWSVQHPSGGSIDDKGLYTPPAQAPTGPVTIIASSLADPHSTGSATVTVS